MKTFHIVPSASPLDIHAVGFHWNIYATEEKAFEAIEDLEGELGWEGLEVTDSEALASRGITNLPKL